MQIDEEGRGGEEEEEERIGGLVSVNHKPALSPAIFTFSPWI